MFCRLQGRHSSTCTSPVKRRHCFADGHKAGDISCTMTTSTSVGGRKQQQQETTALQEEHPLTLPTITRSKYRLKRKGRSHIPTRTQQKRAHTPSADSLPRSANMENGKQPPSKNVRTDFAPLSEPPDPDWCGCEGRRGRCSCVDLD